MANSSPFSADGEREMSAKVAVMQAHQRGARIERRPHVCYGRKPDEGWVDASCPQWEWSRFEYRVKRPAAVELSKV